MKLRRSSDTATSTPIRVLDLLMDLIKTNGQALPVIDAIRAAYSMRNFAWHPAAHRLLNELANALTSTVAPRDAIWALYAPARQSARSRQRDVHGTDRAAAIRRYALRYAGRGPGVERMLHAVAESFSRETPGSSMFQGCHFAIAM